MTDPAPQTPPVVTASVQTILEPVLTALKGVPGVCSIALCGSRARGSATPGSDFDLMVFAPSAAELDLAAAQAALREIGGKEAEIARAVAEITVNGQKVELFFRYIDAVAAELERARAGQFRRNFNPLHTLGFLSTILVSYVAYCRPIWDPGMQLRNLMAAAEAYPEPLRRRMIAIFLSEAGLALMHVSKVRSPQELVYLAGLYARIIGAWGLVLFAANRRYPIIDKDMRQLVAALPQCPANFDARTQAILRAVAAGNIGAAFEEANRLHREVAAIARAKGQPAGAGDAPSDAPQPTGA